jgi:hypothetical protein
MTGQPLESRVVAPPSTTARASGRPNSMDSNDFPLNSVIIGLPLPAGASFSKPNAMPEKAAFINF